MSSEWGIPLFLASASKIEKALRIVREVPRPFLGVSKANLETLEEPYPLQLPQLLELQPEQEPPEAARLEIPDP